MPNARPDDTASGEGPKSSIERRQLLETYPGLQIPERNTEGTAALYKFIDCETLSRKDNLELSQWLERADMQNVGLLAAMQQIEPLFVPTLNLKFAWSSRLFIGLLQQASASGMTFGVSVTDAISKSVAQKLSDVMASQPPCVTSFDDATI